ncbi:MAG: EamA family transporter [Gammaproteobacteria bacterium]|nr:EamA family transporter [Gammaproteobacteria bacterium]TVQ48590.1 MAG: EamA/RhaT family transporter [Gammaproteobacteria bacterium]
MSRKHPASHWLGLLALVLLWGSAFLFVSIALGSFSALQIAGTRIIIAGGVLVALCLVLGPGLPGGRRQWAYFLAMGITGNCLPFLLIAWGQQHVPSGEAGILMALVPLMVMVLAHFLLPGERLTRRRTAGFLLGFAGVVVLIGPQHLGGLLGQEAQLARLALLGATISYATAGILAQYQPNRDMLQSAAGTLLTASAVMLVLMVWAGELAPPVELTPGPLLAVVALGLLCTAAANLVFFWLAHRSGAPFLSLSNYLVPCVAVGLGAVFAGERLPADAWLALTLILGGLALCQRRARLS